MNRRDSYDRVVITGIGLVTSTGHDREAAWAAVRRGRSGARWLRGLAGFPDNQVIAATVALPAERPNQLKVIPLCQRAAAEALADARMPRHGINRERFACAVSAHMADTGHVDERLGLAAPIASGAVPWWRQWWPNTACEQVANRHELFGPRICHSTACASGLIDVLWAVRAIQDGQCDLALAGSGEGLHPLFVAGFRQMRVLAYDVDPAQAARPFDVSRHGFVMGEGAAMLVLERLPHALARGARVYAEVLGFRMAAEAQHVTDIDPDSHSLAQLIADVLERSALRPEQIGLIGAHGTGTEQNDLAEARAIHRVFRGAAREVSVTAAKSMIGHLVNASGSVELALVTLALRDGFVPPTINLTHPDPACDLDCTPLVGRQRRCNHALKLSVAFGGHLAGVAIRRWNDDASGFPYPS